MTIHLEKRARSNAFFFGPKDRPLFGALHRPERWSGARILLCPPLGYEATFAQLTLSDLGARLAAATGAVVMRFDYDGLGDSAGTDEEPDRVGAAVRSVHHALDYLRSLGDGPGPLLVIGLRAGALLGAYASAERKDVDAFALWAPCASGRNYLREQRAFSQITDANPPAPPGLERSWGAQGFEANGYVFTDETVTALEALSFKTLKTPPAPEILALHRTDMPSGFKPTALWPQAHVEEQSFAGFDAMIEPPWLYVSPGVALDCLVEWSRRVIGDSAEKPAAPLPIVKPEPGLVSPNVEEAPVWFGDDERLFGILTRAPSAPLDHAFVIVTSTYGYRIGSSRANVLMARHLAERRIATLRIDLTGVGESRVEREVTAMSPYDLRTVADVLAAVRHLRSLGYAKITVCGVCAGAYLAFETALASEDLPLDVVLVNTQTWEPLQYDRDRHVGFLSERRAAEAARDREPTGRLSIMWSRVRQRAKLAKQLTIASLPSRLRPTALPSKLLKLGRSGSKLVLVFSKGDHGLRQYIRATGTHYAHLHLRKMVKIRVIDGPDHSFTPRWAVLRLADVLRDELELLSSRASGGSRRRTSIRLG